MVNQSLDEKELDWETLKSFTLGLVQVAKVDTFTADEKSFIRAFFEDSCSSLKEEQKESFDQVIEQQFALKQAKELFNSEELKNYFLKSCVMLACIDEFTSDEKKLIAEFAKELGVSEEQLTEITKEVQNELLESFSGITIYTDSLAEVAQRIGIEEINK